MGLAPPAIVISNMITHQGHAESYPFRIEIIQGVVIRVKRFDHESAQEGWHLRYKRSCIFIDEAILFQRIALRGVCLG